MQIHFAIGNKIKVNESLHALRFFVVHVFYNVRTLSCCNNRDDKRYILYLNSKK